MTGIVDRAPLAISANQVDEISPSRIGRAFSSLTDFAFTNRIASGVGTYLPRSERDNSPIETRNRALSEAAWAGTPDPSTIPTETASAPFLDMVTKRLTTSKWTGNEWRVEGRRYRLKVLVFGGFPDSKWLSALPEYGGSVMHFTTCTKQRTIYKSSQ